MSKMADTRVKVTPNYGGCHPKFKDKSVENNKPQTLRQILHGAKPPFTVKLCRGELDKYLPLRPTDNKPVLLKVAEIRRKKNVLARKMQWDRKTEDYVPTGSQLEIPSTYRDLTSGSANTIRQLRIQTIGWFEVLPDDGRPVEYFDTIHGITSVKPRRFLVRTSTVGYQLTVDETGSSWTPCEVRPGEVLTTGIVYNDQKKHKAATNMKNLFKRILRPGRFNKREHDLRYLQCFDDSGKEIMIPLIMSGVFSPIGEISETNYDAVYDLQDMLLAFSLPLKLQLVHGNPKQKQVVPNGVLRIEGARDQEYAMIKIASPKYASDEIFEVPVDCDLLFSKEEVKLRKTISQTTSPAKPDPPSTPEEQNVNKDVSLPLRVPNKENRKLKGANILEKLSARKSKKERASLKALQQEGVFSSRLNKAESTYDDFFYKGEEEIEDDDKTEEEKIDRTSSENKSESQEPTETPEVESSSSEVGYAVVRKRQKNGETVERPRSIQERTLPPIPVDEEQAPNTPKPTVSQKTRRISGNHVDHVGDDLDDSTETLYEKLPPAPKPPNTPSLLPSSARVGLRRSASREPLEDDGYLIPAEAKIQFERSPSNDEIPSDVYVRRRISKGAAREEHRAFRTQRSRSEYGTLSRGSNYSGTDCPLDIDDLFDFSASVGGLSDKTSPYGDHAGPRNLPKYQTPTLGMMGRRSASRDMLSYTGTARYKSVSQRNLNVDSNATIRSHNIRKLRTAMEVFNFSDSFKDLRDERVPPTSEPMELLPDQMRIRYIPQRKGDDYHASSNYTPQRHVNGRDSGIGGISYAESEPGYRHYPRSVSVTGLSDTYVKHGDDSAISLCSRGDYGYHAESEYSFTDYRDPRDDGWIPPTDVIGLTVPEVSKSLRYIGMKDRVVIRFAQEQIDGSMLCSLDRKLLQEGFPELNGLEVKKILDFLGGWRPKK